jgi:hypothetical protein
MTFSRRAVLEWNGDVMEGDGDVTAGTRAFAVPVTFPTTAGEAPGKTTPRTARGVTRDLLRYRASLAHRTTRRTSTARAVTATVTAEKGPAESEFSRRT